MDVIINNDFIRKSCPFCKSVLGVYKDDIHVVEFSGDYIICKVCGGIINISQSTIPNHWKSDLYKEFD